MLFSDNVAVEDEIRLKDEAVRRGLLLMGPDCGTAIIQGVMLGFANKVRAGDIGVVGASGTGTQEVTCLIDALGCGITQAIGTGGRDLKEKVAGRTTLFAIDMLARDPATKVLVVISKPPAAPVAAKVIDRLTSAGKPAVVHFVGAGLDEQRGNIRFAPDLESAARIACELSDGKVRAAASADQQSAPIAAKLSPAQKYLHGLFTGGTMAAEAVAYLASRLPGVRDNLHDELPADLAPGHVVIDLGADEFTRGRPHPMIDPRPRVERTRQLSEDATVAVLLLDVVLGTGSHADPAGEMVPAIELARAKAAARGGYLPVVASVTGTPGDTQGRDGQIAKLERAGVVVMASNIQATRLACAIAQEASRG